MVDGERQIKRELEEQKKEYLERNDENDRYVDSLHRQALAAYDHAAAIGEEKKETEKLAMSSKTQEVYKKLAAENSTKATQDELKKQREAQFEHEKIVRKKLEETSKYFEQELTHRTDVVKENIDKQKQSLDDLKSKYEEINKAQRTQKESYQERVTGIMSAGLSEQGKAIQQRGLAASFAAQAQSARGRKDFEEELRLLQKAQDIMGGLAETDLGAFQDFQWLQGEITSAFEEQRKANQDAQGAAKAKIEDLRVDLANLFVEAEKMLEIKVDTREAKKRLSELRGGLENMRLPFEQSGTITKKTQAAPTIVVNINEKVDKDTVRKTILPELERLQRMSIAIGE
jgi:actin-related protein